MVDCRCNLPLAPPDNRPYWRPMLDPEPNDSVTTVVLYGQHPDFLRMVRVPGGWHTRGAAASHADLTPPEPWITVGRCYAGRQHAVVDATNASVEAP